MRTLFSSQHLPTADARRQRARGLGIARQSVVFGIGFSLVAWDSPPAATSSRSAAPSCREGADAAETVNALRPLTD